MPPTALELRPAPPAAPPASPPRRAPLRIDIERSPASRPATRRAAERDVALDLLRGLAMAILVVNHVPLDSALSAATGSVLSAAEVLVAVSGVVVGMVFGRRWLVHGARATTAMLLRRSRKLYVASVVVVALVGVLTAVPGMATDALTTSPAMQPAQDLYAFDGTLRMLLAVVTLEAGPWQFSILGFFIAVLAAAPALLFALARGWWPVVVAASWALFAAGRAWPVDVLPMQSERPFPILVWQALFVHGVVLGWHRDALARFVARHKRAVVGGVLTVAGLAAWHRLHRLGFDPLGLDAALGTTAAEWARWEAEHFDKASLDALRLATMVSLTTAAYVLLRRWAPAAQRALGGVLLALGRNSFYVFIMHVFLCLAIASAGLTGAGLGLAGNTLLHAACLGVLVLMVRRRFLFRWVPR